MTLPVVLTLWVCLIMLFVLWKERQAGQLHLFPIGFGLFTLAAIWIIYAINSLMR